MGLCCKLAGVKYDLEQRYPLITKLEQRLCVVERELNRNNPCLENGHGRKDPLCKRGGCCGDECPRYHGHHGHHAHGDC